ncbi:hypothetical protein V1477_008285 [Vespula maculifrons]|uniref:Uncharacterized protein n=1 Tax=Vespula maculifrons TaxID=7453 RepID=A0ABD2CCK3_VESMC
MLELFHNAFLLINNINKTDESTNNQRVLVTQYRRSQTMTSHPSQISKPFRNKLHYSKRVTKENLWCNISQSSSFNITRNL